MPGTTRFSTRVSVNPPKPRKIPTSTTFDYRGLDITSPHDLIQNGRTPFAHDFRLYSEDTDGRRVPISTRRGQSEYLGPFDETLNVYDIVSEG